MLNYGSLNIDYTYRVPHIVVPGETLQSLSLERNAGGKGANQSAAAAKAGLEVFHAGKLGKDGLFLKELLDSYGVDTSFITVTDGASGNAIIQVDEEGQNSIVLYAGTNQQITSEEIDAALSAFSKYDLLLLQNEINGIAELIDKAYDKGMKIIFNPAPFSPDILSLPLSKVSIFIVNEIEGAGLSGVKGSYEEILEALVSDYPEAEIILTCGKHGALYGYKDKREKGDIIDYPVVDTTGAGDTFIGYYIASREMGLSVSAALKYACKASSIAISRPGAMAAVPSLEEVFTGFARIYD